MRYYLVSFIGYGPNGIYNGTSVAEVDRDFDPVEFLEVKQKEHYDVVYTITSVFEITKDQTDRWEKLRHNS